MDETLCVHCGSDAKKGINLLNYNFLHKGKIPVTSTVGNYFDMRISSTQLAMCTDIFNTSGFTAVNFGTL